MVTTAITSPAETFADELLFAEMYLRIKTKRMKIEPFRLNPMQYEFRRNRKRKNLILKARQEGMSTWIQAHSFWKGLLETSTCLTLSDTDANTKKLRAIYNRFYARWPEHLLGYRPPRAKDSEALVSYPHNETESAIITAGSKTGTRSSTASFIHMSEYAFWKDPETVFSATMASATPDCEVDIESTPNGAQGDFYELCYEALDGNKEWAFHFFPWWWAYEYRLELEPGEVITPTDEEQDVMRIAADGGFLLTPEQIKWRRATKKTQKGKFLQEYPETPRECFLRSGRSYFGNLEHVWWNAEGIVPGAVPTVAGLDFGQSNDWTWLAIGDATTRKQVAVYYWRRLPWAVMRHNIVMACRKWNVTHMLAEANSIGSVNIEALQDDLPGVVQPFMTTAQSKPPLMQSLHEALENMGLLLVREVNEEVSQPRQFEMFVARQTPAMHWVYEASGNEHDDAVIAAGLMWYAMNKPEIADIAILEG